MRLLHQAAFVVLIAAVSGCGARTGAESSQLADSGLPADTGVGVERLTVPTDGSVVSTVGSFPASSLVRIEIRGIVQWGGCNSSVCPRGEACAFTRYADANYVSDDCFATTYTNCVGTHIAVEIDGRDVDWGPYSSEHVYTVDKPGNGAPFTFSYLDCGTCYGDNAGEFEVLVTPLR